MSKNLNWTKEAFARTTTLLDNGSIVGQMQRESLFGRDVDAYLHTTYVRFDVTGFILHSVDIYDLKQNNQVIGHITFNFGKRATLHLATGQTYLWRRHNMLMRDWEVIREGDAHTPEQEIVNYQLTRQFLADHGDIAVDNESADTDLIVLAGLFIRNYFQRRRRVAAS